MNVFEIYRSADGLWRNHIFALIGIGDQALQRFLHYMDLASSVNLVLNLIIWGVTPNY
jgi:hypothetical protein